MQKVTSSYASHIRNDLNQAHEKMHLIGNTVRNEYQEGDVINARDGLTELQAAFDLMNSVLERM